VAGRLHGANAKRKGMNQMTDEMMGLLSAFFLYHGDATWGWWFVWGLICFLYVLQSIGKAKRQRDQDIKDALGYWSGK